MKNTTWQNIQPGQIVRFIYKSKNSSRGIQRTVLIIDPKYRYRKKSTNRSVDFVVGLQLDTILSTPINVRSFNKLISQFGGLFDDGGIVEVGNQPNRTDAQRTEDVYKTIERFLQKNDVFRTFFLRECRKRRVFLLDSYKRFPKKSLDNLQLRKRLEQTLKKIEEF
tara:strand:+ start:228 stop:725 length:498 start_codon:yes stop_codon:yes gene_type:complete